MKYLLNRLMFIIIVYSNFKKHQKIRIRGDDPLSKQDTRGKRRISHTLPPGGIQKMRIFFKKEF